MADQIKKKREKTTVHKKSKEISLKASKKAQKHEIVRIQNLLRQKRFLKVYTLLSKYYRINELQKIISKEQIKINDPQKTRKIMEELLNNLK